MNKYHLVTSEGRHEFITASSKEEALLKAKCQNPYEIFISCEIYYNIS